MRYTIEVALAPTLFCVCAFSAAAVIQLIQLLLQPLMSHRRLPALPFPAVVAGVIDSTRHDDSRVA